MFFGAFCLQFGRLRHIQRIKPARIPPREVTGESSLQFHRIDPLLPSISQNALQRHNIV